MKPADEKLPAVVEPGEAPLSTRWELIRDLAAFQFKLLLDGIKDVVLVPLSLVAGVVGLLTSRDDPGRAFYSVLRAGRTFDHWVGLYDADRQGRALPPATSDPSASGLDVRAPPRLDDHVKDVERKLRDPGVLGGKLKTAARLVDGALDRAVESTQKARSGASPDGPDDPSSPS